MWVMLNDSFVSAVRDNFNDGNVLVRARRKEDLEAVFPNRASEMFEVKNSDYAIRISVSKKDFAAILVERIFDIDYSNFKKSVKDETLHDFYNNVWWEGLALQESHPMKDFWKFKDV